MLSFCSSEDCTRSSAVAGSRRFERKLFANLQWSESKNQNPYYYHLLSILVSKFIAYPQIFQTTYFTVHLFPLSDSQPPCLPDPVTILEQDRTRRLNKFCMKRLEMAFMCLREASLVPLSLSNYLAFHSFTCETTDIFSTCQHSHETFLS